MENLTQLKFKIGIKKTLQETCEQWKIAHGNYPDSHQLWIMGNIFLNEWAIQNKFLIEETDTNLKIQQLPFVEEIGQTDISMITESIGAVLSKLGQVAPKLAPQLTPKIAPKLMQVASKSAPTAVLELEKKAPQTVEALLGVEKNLPVVLKTTPKTPTPSKLTDIVHSPYTPIPARISAHAPTQTKSAVNIEATQKLVKQVISHLTKQDETSKIAPSVDNSITTTTQTVPITSPATATQTAAQTAAQTATQTAAQTATQTAAQTATQTAAQTAVKTDQSTKLKQDEEEKRRKNKNDEDEREEPERTYSTPNIADNLAPMELLSAKARRSFMDPRSFGKYYTVEVPVTTSIKENVLSPRESTQRKLKKQKYKVVYIQDGKKIEVFASSIRGIRRIIYGKKQYRIFNSSGSDMTGYFKKLINKKD